MLAERLPRRQVPGRGRREAAATAQVDAEAALAWRDFMVSDYSDAGQVRWLAGKGIDLLRGTGKLAGPGVVEVNGLRHTASHVVVATGSDPVVPPIQGLRELAGVWTNRGVTGMKAIPRRLLILGGGPVGASGVVSERLGDEDAGVVDESVDAPEALECPADDPVGGGGLGHVPINGEHGRVPGGLDRPGTGHDRPAPPPVLGDEAGADAHPPESYAGLGARLPPVGHVGQVSDIVDGILFLESSPFITGEILHIDGGQIAGH
jgi:hypothetical protein